MDSSPSFSSSFVTSCRFWLAANSIWATLVVAAAATVAMRLRIDKSWPFIAFVILLSAGLAFRDLWKSKLRFESVKTLLYFTSRTCQYRIPPLALFELEELLSA